MHINCKIIINKAPLLIENQLWNIREWSRIWTPMQKIDVLYEDMIHQEIKMQVDRDGVTESNRTIRLRDINGGTILFVSLEPPPMLCLHKGVWIVKSSKGKTVLEAQREFQLVKNKRESILEYNFREQEFAKKFTSRLSCILHAFKYSLERKDVNYV